MIRLRFALACLLALAPAVLARPAGAEMLEDSTTVEAWKLPNGLQVRVRQVPGARSVAISLAYRAGSCLEPAALPDLAPVLAQVQFTAPVGSIPERTLAEMSSVRPLGWGVTTNPRLSLLTEVAAPDRFVGVLHEVAMRARGVQVSDSCLAHVVAAVRRDAGERRFGRAQAALYERVRDAALGMGEAQALERSRGRAFARLTRARADSLLKTYYVASNASLALVGDFSHLDVRALIEREFGPVAPGSPQPDPPAEPLAAATRVSVLNSMPGPASVVGIIAPAIEDSLHPAFYLSTLILGSWWGREHKDSAGFLDSHFQYSLLDEPELARFDAEIPAEHSTVSDQVQMWGDAMNEYAQLAVTADVRTVLRASVRWLIGGPLTPAQVKQAANTPTFLSTLATTTATRALWKGDAFWAAYLERFESARFGSNSFLGWLTAPEHQAVVVLKPRP